MTGSAAEFPDETIDSGVVVTRWYLFADEFGNFDYTRKQGATRYFAVGTLMVAGDEGRIAVRDALNKAEVVKSNETSQAFWGCGVVARFWGSLMATRSGS